MILPMQIYEAARETCLRLYVANGGDARDLWRVQPHPGTAAISCETDYRGKRVWTLCMPALPLDVRVPRWQADLIAAYTVHELLHALWSNWDIVRQSKIEGLGMLTNAIEDCRIEGKASAGALRLVSEARRLLQILNAHIYQRAAEKPAFNLADENQFAFILTLVLFSEKLGYVSAFPGDWRKRVAKHLIPVFEHALARFPSLASTEDALQLARELRDMAKATKPEPKAPSAGDEGKPEAPKGDEGDDDEASEGKGKPEAPKGDEGEGDDDDEASEGAGKGEGDDDSEGDDDEGEGAGEGDDEGEGGKAQQGASHGSGSPFGDKGDDDEGDDSEAAGEASERDGETGKAGKGGDGAGLSNDASQGDDEAPSPDLSDKGQDYSEANLDDLSTTKGMQEAPFAGAVLNAKAPRFEDCTRRGNAKQMGAVISTPAKLRRHVTSAVKAPERVGNERYQTSGRLDTRNVAGLASGAETVFRKRVEDEGREAAVTLLIDVSSSMEGERIDAARAMALHMGDALKAAGVRFEIATFRHASGDTASMSLPKPMKATWNDTTRSFTAGIRAQGGTVMLPAIKNCAERLLDVRAVSRRILIVLTDGLDSFDTRCNEIQCKALATKGVEVLGIGLMLTGREVSAMATTFAANVVYVNDCAALATTGLAHLVKQLDKAAPKGA
jgi:hypothetical protein